MIEDLRGKIWLGTHNGELNRFDRTTETFIRFHHDPNDSTSLPLGAITSLCEQGPYIWITTSGPGIRLCRLETRNGTVDRYRHSPADRSSISSDNVISLACDRFGRLWGATEDAGLNRFDPETGGFINGAHNPAYAFAATGPLFRLYADPTERIWLWYDQDVQSIDPLTGAMQHEQLIERKVRRMKTGRVYAIHYDRSGLLWIGGSNGGVSVLARLEGSTTEGVHNDYDPYSLSSGRIYAMMEDRSGNIWMGTDNGVSKFNRRNWHPRYFQHDPLNPNTISNKVVRNIIKDRHGDLWVATEVGGVNKIAAATGIVTRYQQYPGDPRRSMDQTANVLYEDSEGYIYGPERTTARPGSTLPPEGSGIIPTRENMH